MNGLLIIIIVLGVFYGIASGIPLGMYLVSSMLEKKNRVSKGEKVSFTYSTRGVEVFNRSIEEEYVPLGGKSSRNKLSGEAKQYRENVEYFKRNII